MFLKQLRSFGVKQQLKADLVQLLFIKLFIFHFVVLLN